MQPRGTLIAAGLMVVLLLLATVWLVEWPPLADTPEPAGEPPAVPEATGGEAPAQPPRAAEREPPGLKSTAPVDLRTPPVAPKVPPKSPPKPLSPGVAPRRPAAAAPGPVELKKQPSGKEVVKALDRAVTWLRKHQARSGGWGPVHDMGAYEAFHRERTGTHAAGPTALALYALLARSQPLKDPVVRKGFDFLWKHHHLPQTSMETAAVLLAVAATAEARVSTTTNRGRRKPKLSGRYRAWAMKLVNHLVNKRRARGWRYNVTGRVEALQAGGPEDLVSTHLSALALFAAHRLGIKTKDVVWDEILRYTLAQQEDHTLYRPDPAVPRGFAYILGHAVSDAGKATGGTTACGIALVRMTTYVLTDGGQRPNGIRERDEVLQQSVAASLEPAYAWLERHWSAYANPGKQPGQKVLHHHWLWAVETAQDLDPERPLTVGTHGWYLEMAEQLVNRQRSDGSWRVWGTWEPADVLDTALAILFLQRATRRLVDPR